MTFSTTTKQLSVSTLNVTGLGVYFPDGSLQTTAGGGGGGMTPGDTNYIQNRTDLQNDAVFNISSGTVEGPLTVYNTLDVEDLTGVASGKLYFDPYAGGFGPYSLNVEGKNGGFVYFRMKNYGNDVVQMFSSPSSLPLASSFFSFNLSTDTTNGTTPLQRMKFFGDPRGTQFSDHLGTTVLSVFKSSVTSAQTFNAQKGVNTTTMTITGLTSQNCLGTDGSGNLQAGTCGGGGGSSSLEVVNSFDGTRSSPTSSIGLTNSFRGTVSGSSYTIGINFSSITAYGSAIPAAAISAGSLGASVLASSVAATAFQAGISAGSNITVTNTGNGVSIAAATSGNSPSLEVVNTFDNTRTSPTVSIGLSNAFLGSVTSSSYTIRINGSSVTAQGNTFNTTNSLVKLDGTGIIPASILPSTIAYTNVANTFTSSQTVNSSFVVSSNTIITSTGSSAGTSNALKIVANGTYGTSAGSSGGLFVDCTGGGPASGMCAQVYTNAGAQTALGGVLNVIAANTAWNEPILYLKNASTAAQSTIRMDSGQPTFTMVDTSLTSPAGKFQWSDHLDTLRFESRNSADGAFEPLFILSRATSTGRMFIGNSYTTAVSTVDIKGNLTVGTTVAGVTTAPVDGLLVAGSIQNLALAKSFPVQTDANQNLVSAAISSVTSSVFQAGISAGSNVTVTNTGNGVSIAATGGAGTPGGSNTQFQYNNSSAFGGTGSFQYFVSSNAVTISSYTNIVNVSTVQATGTYFDLSQSTMNAGQYQKAGQMGGLYMQIANFSATTSSSTPSTSFFASDLAVTITPKLTSSTVTITACFDGTLAANVGAPATATFSLYRNNTTNLGDATNGLAILTPGFTNASQLSHPMCLTYDDTPASTSATTYTVYMKTSSASVAAGVGSGEKKTIRAQEYAQ